MGLILLALLMLSQAPGQKSAIHDHGALVRIACGPFESVQMYEDGHVEVFSVARVIADGGWR